MRTPCDSGFPWQQVFIDVFLFLISELLVRFIIFDGNNKRVGTTNQYQTLLLIQVILLANFSVLVYAFHHIPVVLMACTIAVLIRLLMHYFGGEESGGGRRPAISKRLKFIKDEKDDCERPRGWSSQPNTPVGLGNFNTSLPAATNTNRTSFMPSPAQVRPPLRSYAGTPSLYNRKTLPGPPANKSQQKNDIWTTIANSRQNPRTSFPICGPIPIKDMPLGAMTSPLTTNTYCNITPNIIRSMATSTNRVSPSQQQTAQLLNVGKIKPPGIINTGNICFMISIIHCLACIEEFISFLSSFPFSASPTPPSGTEYNHCLIKSLQSLIVVQCQNWNINRINPNHLSNAISTLAPHLITTNTGRTQTQQDAGEFLMWLLDTLHEVCNTSTATNTNQCKIQQLIKEKETILNCLDGIDSTNVPSYRDDLSQLSIVDYQLLQLQNMSPVYKMCCGQILEARECQDCKKVSINVEYYTILSLPVPMVTNQCSSYIDECFELFGQVENLTQCHNMLQCSCTLSGGGSPGKRLALLNHLPPQLIIQLNRYSYDSYHDTALKNQSSILFHIRNLDLTPYTLSHKLGYESPPKRPLYDLTGFCVHTGARSTSYGHYIAYCKTKDGSWYCFDDDRVSPIKDIEREIEQPFVTQNVYLLFYTAKK